MEWLNLFPGAKINYHVFTSSDHCQVSINLGLHKGRKSPPFRFDKIWTTRKVFDAVIKKAWCTKFTSYYMYCFMKKCKLLKEKAKIWSTTRFGNIFRQLRTVETKLKALHDHLLIDPNYPKLCAKQNKFLAK